MDLERLKRLSGEATAGPWTLSDPEFDRGIEYGHVYAEPEGFEILYQLPADAALIAALGSVREELLACAETLELIRYGCELADPPEPFAAIREKAEVALAALDGKLGEL